MTTPVTFASARQFLGLAKETVHGTPVAPTVTAPVDEFTPDQGFEQLKDQAWRGHLSATSGIVQGVTKTEFDGKGPAFLDTIGHLLLNLLGDLTTTPGTPNTHAFSLLNSGSAQPPSHTFTHFQGPGGTAARTVPGGCLSELALKWNAESELLTCEWKGTGWGTQPAGSTPSNSPSTVPPLGAWRARLGIGGPATGGTLAANVESVEISMKRNLKPLYTVSGRQDPYVIQRGTLEVTGKVKFIADSDAPFLALLNHTQPQLQIAIDNGGAGSALQSLTVDVQRASYTASKLDGGAEAIAYDNDFEALANTTNAGASGGMSPVRVTVRNALSSY